MPKQRFDDWPERYERWFRTPIGALVKEYEQELVLELLKPQSGELILDVGCGTGIFTESVLVRGSKTVGVDISEPMLQRARSCLPEGGFMPIAADMLALPFADGRFDKTLSVTALEFIEDARRAVDELFRVTRPWGLVVVATLNSLSPWAVRRRGVARTDKRNIFHNAHFRSPRQLAELAPIGGTVKTAIHFDRDEHPSRAAVVEREGRLAASDKGAFLAACWQKP